MMLWHIFETSDSSEALLGFEQAGDAPAMPHVTVSISLDPPRDFTDSPEHRFDGIGRGEESFPLAFETKSENCESFF